MKQPRRAEKCACGTPTPEFTKKAGRPDRHSSRLGLRKLEFLVRCGIFKGILIFSWGFFGGEDDTLGEEVLLQASVTSGQQSLPGAF